LVENTDIKCPACGSTRIKKEFGEVMVCSDCNHKFNVHQPQSISLKIIVLSVFFIAGLFGVVKFSIPKFDEQQAMEELVQQQTKTSQTDYTPIRKITDKSILYVNDNEIWLSQIINTANTASIELSVIDGKTKTEQRKIILDELNTDDLNTTISATAFKNTLYILVNHSTIYSINLSLEKIILTNIDFISKYKSLSNGIQKIEYNKGLQAFLFQNLDGAIFYYFPQNDLFVSSQELTQLRKSEQINDSWQFEKKYVINDGKLFMVMKKHQNYVPEISSSDIQTIFEGAEWMKKNYAITSVQPVLNNVNFNNTEVLFSNENEIICANEIENKISYYNLKNNKNWHRTIDNMRNKIFFTTIQGNKIIIFHSNNVYTFDKENGALIWKY